METASNFHRLYVHVPFCSKKCGYCAFYSEPNPAPELIARYFDKLEADMARYREFASPLRSVYIGGGTPSRLSARELARLFDLIDRYFRLGPEAEITIECNPESVTAEKAEVLAARVNRISLGAQSFDPGLRAVLRRAGDAADIFRAIETLLTANLNDLSLDLIYAIPGQDLNAWEKELRTALALPISHLSAYALTAEEGTALTRSQIAPVSETLEIAMWDLVGELPAAEKNLRRYEISNYAIPGRERAHNLDIWFGDSYLGLGPAAASFDGSDRWTERPDIRQWLDGAAPDLDRVPRKTRVGEILSMGLRVVAGWDEALFRARTGETFASFEKELRELEVSGLIARGPGKLKPTRKGLLFWNDLALALI